MTGERMATGVERLDTTTAEKTPRQQKSKFCTLL